MKLTKHHSVPKRLLAVALILLTLGLAVASSNEELHQLLHRHGDESACAVYLFAHGLVDAVAAVAIVAAVIFPAVFDLPVLQSVLTGRVDFLLPPGRAPPQSGSSL